MGSATGSFRKGKQKRGGRHHLRRAKNRDAGCAAKGASNEYQRKKPLSSFFHRAQ
jgi:hypothetical protein